MVKALAILFQILGLTSRRSDATNWLRAPQKVPEAELRQANERTRYLRIDAVPNPMVTSSEKGWEEELKEEAILRLDQLGDFKGLEDIEESIMDFFEIDQLEDSTDNEEESNEQ